MNFNKLFIVLEGKVRAALLATCCLLSTLAHADVFTFSGYILDYNQVGSETISGSLTGSADPLRSGAYDLTSASVTAIGPQFVDGNTTHMLNLVPGGPNPTSGANGSLTYDNLLYPDAIAPFDFDGALFGDSAGNLLNLYFDPTVTADGALESFLYLPGVGEQYSYFTFDLSRASVTGTVPEPASIALLFAGAGASLAVARRRRLNGCSSLA